MPPFLDALERLLLIRDGYYSADPHRSRRAAMLLALDRGMPLSSVARSAGYARTTVYYWLRLYLHHRDPATLAGRDSATAGRRGAEMAAAMNAMPGDREAAGVLGLDEAARHALRLDAEVDPDPALRRRAAILWALERGVAASHVAHVAGTSRRNVCRMRRAAVARLRGTAEGGHRSGVATGAGQAPARRVFVGRDPSRRPGPKGGMRDRSPRRPAPPRCPPSDVGGDFVSAGPRDS